MMNLIMYLCHNTLAKKTKSKIEMCKKFCIIVTHGATWTRDDENGCIRFFCCFLPKWTAELQGAMFPIVWHLAVVVVAMGMH